MHKILLSLTLLVVAQLSYAQSSGAPSFRWNVQAGGTSPEEGRGIVSDAQENAYVTGFFRGTATFGTGTTAVQLTSTAASSGTLLTSDAFLAKYNSNGVLQWARRHGGPGNEEALGLAIDRQGNLFMVGSFAETATFGAGSSAVQLTSAGSDDVFLSKFDPAGDLLWARRLGSASASAENGYAVAVDSAGNSVITGEFREQASVGTGTGSSTLNSGGGSDVFIVKYDPAGTLQWARRGTGTGSVDAGRAICTDRAGNIILTGSFRDVITFEGGTGSTPVRLRSRAAADLFVVKYDPQGNPLWGRLGTGAASEIGRGIATDRAKNIYMFTSFRGSAYFLSSANDSIQAQSPAANVDDLVLVKYSAAGTVQWLRTDGGTGTEESIAVSTDASDNVYALSYFQLSGPFGATGTSGISNTPVTLTSAGSSDIAVASYTSAGAFRWAQRMGGPGVDAGYGIAHGPANSTVLTGYFTAGPFTAGNNQFPLSTQPSTVRDIFVAKMVAVTPSTRSAQASGRVVQIYPNPAISAVRISTTATTKLVTLTLVDVLGRPVRSVALSSATEEVMLPGLAAGRYTALLTWADGLQSASPLVVLP